MANYKCATVLGTRQVSIGPRKLSMCCSGLVASILAVAVVVPASCSTASTSTTDQPRIVGCRLGFDGAYKLGFWTPVWIEIAGGTQTCDAVVEVVVPDSDDVLTSVRRPVHLRASTTTSTLVYTKVGKISGPVTVKLRVAEEVVATAGFGSSSNPGNSDPQQAPAGFAAGSQLLVEISGTSVGLADAVRLRRVDDAETASHVVRLTSLARLPTQWYGYETVDYLVISGGDASLFEGFSSEDPRLSAIRRWVEMGGRLAVCCGQRAPDLLAPTGPLARLIPGTFSEMVSLDRAAALEHFTATDAAVASGRKRLNLPVARLTEVTGRIEAYAGSRPTDLPLVIRAPLGFGEIVFAAVDLDQPPLADWQSRPEFLRKLLGWDENSSGSAVDRARLLTTRGYDDLAGALRNRLGKNFTGVAAVSFGLVTVVVLVYLALIGPLDYLLVQRVLGRMGWTWVTFPSIIVLVSLGAYWYACSQKGSQLRINQAEVVDFDLATGMARGTYWNSLYSPQARRFDLSLLARWPDGTNVDLPNVLISWLGLPGTGLGAMQAGDADDPFEVPYQFAKDLDAIRGLPIQVWSTKALTARWHAQAPPLITADLVETGDGLVEGTFANQAGMDLDDARLLFGSWAWRLGDVADGATVQVDNRRDPLKVKTLLTQGLRNAPAIQATGSRQDFFVAAQASLDQLLDMMMFYKAVGGYQFTGLRNRYQSFCDLSNQLEHGRAVLVARCKKPRSELLNDSQSMTTPQDRHWVVYRFVIPVGGRAKQSRAAEQKSSRAAEP